MLPILFEFGRITIFSLWFFIATGFVTGSLVLTTLAKRNRIKLDPIFEKSIQLFLCTLVVSRLTYIILNPGEYFGSDSSFSTLVRFVELWDKGFSLWGALIAWVAGTYLIARGRNEKAERIFDLTALSFLAGLFFGNIGAFLDGINYGAPTQLPWGVVFRSPNVKYITAIHPTQLYAAVYCLIIVGVLYYLYKNFAKEKPGFTALMGVFLFGAARFIEEFFRGDETIMLGSIRIGTAMALAAALVSGYLLFTLHKETAAMLKEKIKGLLQSYTQ